MQIFLYDIYLKNQGKLLKTGKKRSAKHSVVKKKPCRISVYFIFLVSNCKHNLIDEIAIRNNNYKCYIFNDCKRNESNDSICRHLWSNVRYLFRYLEGTMMVTVTSALLINEFHLGYVWEVLEWLHFHFFFTEPFPLVQDQVLVCWLGH